MIMYENAKYVNDPITGITSSISVFIYGFNWFIPLDPANSDYAAIMALVEAGELVIAPAE